MNLVDVVGLFTLSLLSIYVGFVIGKSVGYTQGKMNAKIQYDKEKFCRKSEEEIFFENELIEKQKK